MSERGIHLGILVGAIALGVWTLRHDPSPSRHVAPTAEHESPLAIVPPGSAFVLSADIAALRRSPFGPLLVARINGLAGEDADWSKLCDFDPLSAIDEVALAVPSAGASTSTSTSVHDDDFGVIASGRFSAAQITRCATAAISARGGDPVSSKLGDFSSVRDRTTEAGEIAARDGGPLILSGGNYFRTLLDSAQGNAPKLEHQDPRDARHAELRRVIGPGAIVATWLLGEHWFERVAGDDAGLSPLRSLEALALRLDLGQTLHASALLSCKDATSTREIQRLLEELRASLATIPLDPALGALARRVTVAPQDRRLRLELELNEIELRALLDAIARPPALSKSHPDAQIQPR